MTMPHFRRAATVTSLVVILLIVGILSSSAPAADAFCPSLSGRQQQQLVVVLKAAATPTRNEDGTIRDSPTVVGGDDWETAEEATMNSKLVKFLQVKYPTFYKLLVRDNEALLKALSESAAHTLLVPNEDAFQALGAKKLQQLLDPRNEEIRDKMGQFHIITGKAVSATELRTEDWTKGRPKDGSKPNTLIAAIVTLAGEVPVGRSKSGGFLFGLGAKEDGDIVIGPQAQILQSFQVEQVLVHEMNDLISPVALWRYVDQLRIPGF